jgi:acetyl esterase/lipase
MKECKKKSCCFLLAVLIGCISSNLKAQTIMNLYDKVPNSKPSVLEEVTDIGTDGIIRISKVKEPTITIYKPDKKRDKGTAVIICPGGGYGILAINLEGTDVAAALNKWGITAIVLKYRLPDDELMLDKNIGSLQDAQRAIQLVRQNAKKWGVDPNKIGIMGFSAGGHLAATASTHFDKGLIDNPDSISLRPDFSILIYPVISFTDEIGHIGSRNALLGKNAGLDLVRFYSNELQVTVKTPPAFLVHASDDEAVKSANRIIYYEALLKNNVPAELHIYEQGGHGFGLNNSSTKDNWMDRLKNWMDANSWLN